MALKQGELHTFGEALKAADFDLNTEAAVEYGDGVDLRRVKVAGLGFDSTDDQFRIPVGVEEIEVTLDGAVAATASVADPDPDVAATATILDKSVDTDSE